MKTRKFDFFFFLSSKLNFDLCQRAEINIQVGLKSLNMHLYEDIGDTLSFLRGSISSISMDSSQRARQSIEIFFFFKFKIRFQNFGRKPKNNQKNSGV